MTRAKQRQGQARGTRCIDGWSSLAGCASPTRSVSLSLRQGQRRAIVRRASSMHHKRLHMYDYATDLHSSLLSSAPPPLVTLSPFATRRVYRWYRNDTFWRKTHRQARQLDIPVARHGMVLTSKSVTSVKSAAFASPVSACSLSRRLFSRIYHSLRARQRHCQPNIGVLQTQSSLTSEH